MRQHLAAALLVASVAHAEPKHDPIDITEGIGLVDVYRDQTGKSYVIPKDIGPKGELAAKWTFYGDGRTMYQQRIASFSSVQGSVTLGAWAPRVRGIPHAMLEKKADGSVVLICRMQSSKYARQQLALVPAADAEKLFKTARFEPPYWERRVAFFGREGTKYYLLDALDAEHGGAGFRLFVGPKGQLKQIPITDFVDDTGGTTVKTKLGVLVIAPGKAGTGTWTQRKKTITLTQLDALPNHYLIYRELGVYGQLGTFCEDQ